ncbi:sugar ABC transporter ATP-binding protein [Aquipuribacter sp. MA13-6]|uniref:sugar ABC transporter ATP-binding protein n=1 Tax=unclassified Aquipuribacter TaxID=2635084 RepID=UPI003EF0409F
MSTPTTPTGPDGTARPLVRMTGIVKSFFGVDVLHGVDLEVRAGEVHALVGENGAGKSTLMKILAGVQKADTGTVEVDGREVVFEHPLQAQHAGVSTVFQEFNLLPERTVAENVYLGREPRRFGLVDARQMNRDTDALLHDLGVGGIRAGDRIGSLSVAQQQVVEIVKALSTDARIISMDEPTAALSGAEVQLLYRLVRTLKERGIAILYVSHRLVEIFDLCDRITVLKDGALVQTVDTVDTSPDELVRNMVGRSVSARFPHRRDATVVGDVRLRLSGAGNADVDSIDLTVRAGEVVGLAGLQGSGRTELANALFGTAPFTRGEMAVDGTTVRPRSPRDAVRAGLALVTEDRKAQGLALEQGVLANARLVLDAVMPRQATRRSADIPGILSSLEFTARAGSREVRFLSGGNQQKVVLAKWLVTDPAVLVLDEPTRGIDVGAKQAVYEIIREESAKGVAVLLISSELTEVIGMADRVVVLRDGRISGELPGGCDEEDVMAMATGTVSAP